MRRTRVHLAWHSLRLPSMPVPTHSDAVTTLLLLLLVQVKSRDKAELFRMLDELNIQVPCSRPSHVLKVLCVRSRPLAGNGLAWREHGDCRAFGHDGSRGSKCGTL